jgi:Tol biopolymer transport system component
MSQTQQFDRFDQSDKQQLWPEAFDVRRATATPFPWRMLFIWLAPGLISGILLLGAYFYFEQRAAKQIVYVTQNGQMGIVQADGRPAQPLQNANLRRLSFTTPQWAPSGKRYAAVSIGTNDPHLIVLPTDGTEPLQIAVEGQNVALIRDGWSVDESYVALIDSPSSSSNRPHVQIVDIAQKKTKTITLTVNLFAPISWHPSRSELLITTMIASITPTLQIVTPDGQERSLVPADQQAVHHSGVWSPDGHRIAYVVPRANAAPDRVTAISGGTIWSANEDGSDAHQLIADGLNSAPIWSPDSSLIFFTREVTETQSFDLYRVRADGQEVTRIGAGLPPNRYLPSQVEQSIGWSPDGSKMFFQSLEKASIVLFVALRDGSDARILYRGGSGLLAPIWSPTNRAILIADSTPASMALQSLDSDKVMTFPTGTTPDWQP